GRNAKHALRVVLPKFTDRCRIDIGTLADENDGSAFGEQLFCASLADAAATAGDDGYFAGKTEIQNGDSQMSRDVSGRGRLEARSPQSCPRRMLTWLHCEIAFHHAGYLQSFRLLGIVQKVIARGINT